MLGIHAVYLGLLPVVVHYRSSEFCQTRFYKCELINRAAGVKEGENARLKKYKQIIINFGQETKKKAHVCFSLAALVSPE